MEIKVNESNVVVALVSFCIGGAVGVLVNRDYNKKHTPEETIKKLQEAKDDLRREQSQMDFKIRQNYDAVAEVAAERRKLEGRKKEYQNEITPEIEAKLRKELQDYISNADKVYAAAKNEKAQAAHEREIAELKLDLAKTLNESVTHTEKETKIIVKTPDEIEEDDE